MCHATVLELPFADNGHSDQFVEKCSCRYGMPVLTFGCDAGARTIYRRKWINQGHASVKESRNRTGLVVVLTSWPE